jgi:hypothetical protein
MRIPAVGFKAEMNELVAREIFMKKLLVFHGLFRLICDGELTTPVECFVTPCAQGNQIPQRVVSKLAA